MAKKLNEELEFWKGVIIRAFVFFGFTIFSVAVTLQDLKVAIFPALLSAGLYMFTELMKYYKIQPQQQVTAKKCNMVYSFII